MALSIFGPQQRIQLHLRDSFPSYHCKYAFTLNSFHLCQAQSFPPTYIPYARVSFQQLKAHVAANLETGAAEDNIEEDVSAFTSLDQRGNNKFLQKKNSARRIGFEKNGLKSIRNKKVGSIKEMASVSKESTKFKDKELLDNDLKMENKEKKTRKPKVDSSGDILRIGLDLCSKRGDVASAIRLYDLARMEGAKIGQYHYAVLLYLCSSAATGVVMPAKSGSGSRSLNQVDPPKEHSFVDSESFNLFGEMDQLYHGKTEQLDGNEPNADGFRFEVANGSSNTSFREEDGSRNFLSEPLDLGQGTLTELVQTLKWNADSMKTKDERGDEFHISEDVRKIALYKGFEIYNQMHVEKVPINEATFTSVARMALALGDGDMAFNVVKQMKDYGLNPRLRSYGPALTVFCNKGHVQKAFMVEEHMVENNVCPEEPELEALLKMSIKAGKSDKVYYVLQKLRTSVRKVSPVTADLIAIWFNSRVAARVGKQKWDGESIARAIESVGGGWHGKGWLGRGKWIVSRTPISFDGLCKFCGEKLATIDLDPAETEKFAELVAQIAAQREKDSSFQKFQKWLYYYGPFEAVVDGANVGLYSQRRFKPSKVNAVVNGIRQFLPSRKWPLIVLHNRRIAGEKMDEPFNRSLIEKWKNADALFATPTGSNDDWYWLYAAIKPRCFIVSNDEMRDHLFQLLGNDFFPKWKERHQVHFSFDETGPVFRLPPPYSVVIQESDKGHWHIPIMSELEQEDQRTWLCCTRGDSRSAQKDSVDLREDLHMSHKKKGGPKAGARLKNHGNYHDQGEKELQAIRSNIKTSSTFCQSILSELEAAEKFGRCLIDFQI